MFRLTTLTMLLIIPCIFAACDTNLPIPLGRPADSVTADATAAPASERPGSPDPNPTSESEDAVPDPSRDNAAELDVDAQGTVEELTAFFNSHILTEIRSSSNFDPTSGLALLQSFRSDLSLCSNGRFNYAESEEITVGADVTRNDFEGDGDWRIQIDEATNGVLLVLNFRSVSKGQPFESKATLDIDENNAVFVNGTRLFRTEGDNLCR